MHLQCHIGTDTLSWARLGAEVVDADFSAEAIRAARTLAGRAQVSARFEQCTNEDAPSTLNDTFQRVLPLTPEQAADKQIEIRKVQPRADG